MAWKAGIGLLTVTTILCFVHLTTENECKQGKTCFLPDCYCFSNTTVPGNLPRVKMPQLVVFAFSGAVNIDVYGYFRHFFNAERTNANGCPISATLFVQSRYSNFTMVNDLYRRGFEIAGYSVSGNPMYIYWKNATAKEMEYEIIENRKGLSRKASIPISEIRGWRTPHLLPVGNAQFGILQEQGFEYDSSLYFIRRKPVDPFITPGTLDYEWPFVCERNRCPDRNYTLWEVPAVSYLDYKQQYPCIHVDGCINLPQNENQAFQLIWNNFYDYYRDRKLPFVVNMKAIWLNTDFHFRAMERFIYSLLHLDDVYVVTMHQLVQWMRRPLDVEQMMYADCPRVVSSAAVTVHVSAMLVLGICMIFGIQFFFLAALGQRSTNA
ncbi:chitin deacetylase 1-like [Gigantopelta aegis]|uniref:chitin deacetylase 1-like n=1 Tax=Gigantopelta aegis TaxID=1735272 RepID=UPI001B888E7A|nr:chitin deacetylase 1-like [Gigantopelta aegis]